MPVQFEVHPKRPESALRAACAAAGIAVVAYASLGCGQLLTEQVVQQVAARTGKTAAQVGGGRVPSTRATCAKSTCSAVL